MVTRIRRYGQITEVLIKYGFGIFVEEYMPGRPRPAEPAERDRKLIYERIRLAIEELGPTFIKFGQIMSTRRELLPPELIQELQKLQDQVAPLPFDEVRPVIEEYCTSLGECFACIDPEPVAAASLSQVHIARLVDGTRVALKVQRPGISELIETDLVILESLAQRAESMRSDLRVYNLPGMVSEFSMQIRKELDFVLDGKNAERLAHNMRSVPGVKVPRIYWEYTGRRMLTMEYIDGVRADNLCALRGMGLNPQDIAEHGFNAYMKQIFIDGVFHGDPHPGNLLVTGDGDLVFLDFGIFGVIRPEKQNCLVDFLLAIVDADVNELIKSLRQLGIHIREESLEPLKDDLYMILLDYREFQIRELDFRMALYGLTDSLRRYQLRVPGNLMQIIKVIMMVTDLGILLDPAFNFQKRVQPHLSEITRHNKFSIGRVKDAARSVEDAFESLIRIPHTLNETLDHFKAGVIKLDFEDRDLRFVQQLSDQIINKIMIAVIIAAIVVGSSLVLVGVDVTLPEQIYLLAIISYAVAVLTGFYAVISAIFARRRII